jgi:hypothetical protein
VDNNIPSLGLFTERFYRRMIQLADYIDISVAVSAIGLIKQLLRCASRVLCSSYISSSLQVTLFLPACS